MAVPKSIKHPENSPHLRKCSFRNPVSFLLMEPRILGFEIWNIVKGIGNLAKNSVQVTKTPESST